MSPLSTVALLERLAAAEFDLVPFALDDAIPPLEFAAASNPDALRAVLELADELEPPGSKTRAVVSMLSGSRPRGGSIVVLTTLESDVPSLEAGLQGTPWTVESVTATMTPDERLAAADRVRKAGGVLIVPDAALSGPLLEGFEVLLHRDAGIDGLSPDHRLALIPRAPGSSVQVVSGAGGQRNRGLAVRSGAARSPRSLRS